jgi:transposase InsO family protein
MPQITAMLKQEGWRVNHKRVERIWRQAGLKIPIRVTAVRRPLARALGAVMPRLGMGWMRGQ